ncbi:MAG: two-component regulator propeller domain-containing protein [Candidatus Aminicenantes bacterium]|jgi:ligand-binding sensor domain-containing protein/tRNA A-37 threonylcarbamoyl transferase component Bud32
MFQKVVNFLICVFILGSGSILLSLDPTREIQEYNLETYTTEDGLPQSSVLTIVQTQDGYLWLGTYEGVARFDGIGFRLFDTANTPEMDSNRIKALLEDSKGNLWIATSGGLLCYRNGYFKNYTTKNGLSNNFVICLCEDRQGRIWVGTTDGLNRFEKGVFTSYTQKHGLTQNYISALVEDNEGTLWIGTSGGGLHHIDVNNGKITHCTVKVYPGNMDIRTLYKDKQGRIWIGTAGKGMAVIEGGKFKLYTQKDGLSGNDIRAIFQDSNGTLWIGTNGQGLNTLKNGLFSFSDSDQGFFSSPVRAILEDREGSLWIGTRDGLSQLKDGKFIIYNRRNGLPVDSVRTVFQDHRGNIWIGTVNGGLVQYKNNQFKTFGIKQGLKSEHIWAIAQSKDNSLWFGTYGGGLHRLKNGEIIEIYTTGSGLANNIIRALFVDPEDNVWVGTNGGGVDILKKEGNYTTVINYSTKNGLSNDFVYAISGDNRGNTWIGTYSGDLNRFNHGNFTVYSVKDGLTGHAIWSIYPDDEGTVWIGTDGGGLVRFKNNTFRRFTVKNGLYSNLAFQVFEDKKENLWMNCNKGIYSVSKKDLEDFAVGTIQTIPYLSFGKTEGIKSTECAGPAQPAGISTREGKLWFPTIRGAVVIDLANIKINQTIPPVIIEEIRADGQLIYSYPHQQKQKILLPAGKKRLEFKYTGLSFIAPQQMNFKYKLVGFEEKWMDGGTQRQVSYTNIAPGDYTFQVIASNNDDVWNHQGANFSFTLEPFFWQTWWFRFLFLIVFAFLSYMLINFVKKHLRLIAFWKKKKYIGSYEIDTQIGVGGMGIVYKVHSLMDRSKTFAMKVMKDEHLLDEVQKKRFKNESLLVDSLDHPHIVKVYERGQHGETLYIVMELLEGQTLAQRYKNNRYPSLFQCIHIISQIAHILVNLHREDIIHRDLKPENIMLINKDKDPDYVKLLDFGIARVQSFSHLTESGQVLGTIPYMPPEVITDGKPSPAVDIYSLGVIAYEMITGQKPFTADGPMETMKKILNDPPIAPIELAPGISPRLNELVLKMIEKNSFDRPDAREVLAILVTLR